MSERSAGQESASPTTAETPADGGDFYAAAARSTAATRSTQGTSAPASDTGAPGQAEEKTDVNEATRVSSRLAAESAESGSGSTSSGSARRRSAGSGSRDTPEPTRTTSTSAGSAGASSGSSAHPDSGEGVALAQGEPRGSAQRKAGMPRSSRKARLRLSRVDPWSVMKTAFLFSIAAGIIVVVAVYVIWSVIGASGLLDSIDNIVGSVLKSPGETTSFRVEQYVNTQKVMGVTALLAVIDAIIITALTTLASFLYNLAATMLGGLEVTLAED